MVENREILNSRQVGRRQSTRVSIALAAVLALSSVVSCTTKSISAASAASAEVAPLPVKLNNIQDICSYSGREVKTSGYLRLLVDNFQIAVDIFSSRYHDILIKRPGQRVNPYTLSEDNRLGSSSIVAVDIGNNPLPGTETAANIVRSRYNVVGFVDQFPYQQGSVCAFVISSANPEQ